MQQNLPEYASVGQRLLHRIIDVTLFYSCLFVSVKLFPEDGTSTPDVFLMLLVFSSPFLYYLVGEAVFGKTLGKAITKTTVLKLDCTKPEWTDILLRSICRLIPLNTISIFFNGFTCWHDKFSGTYVAKDE